MTEFNPGLAFAYVIFTVGILVLVAFLILHIKNYFKTKKKEKEEAERRKELDDKYKRLTPIFDVIYQFTVIDDRIESRYGTNIQKLLKIKVYDYQCKTIKICLANCNYSDTVLEMDINSPVFKVDKEDGKNTTNIQIRFVECNCYVYSTIIDDSTFVNCIFLVGDREAKILNIFVKENGKIVKSFDINTMHWRNAKNTPIYQIISSNAANEHIRYGMIKPWKSIGGVDNLMVQYFCLMCDFDPNYVEKSYDYYY